MSTISNAQLPGGAHRPSGDRLWCPECGTDEYLIVESIEALHPPQESLVDVSYTCVECDFFWKQLDAVACADGGARKRFCSCSVE